MGMGVGAAMTGLRPIVEGMNMGFLLLAFNQISNNCGMLHYTSGGQFKVGGCGAAGERVRARAWMTVSSRPWGTAPGWRQGALRPCSLAHGASGGAWGMQ
jgi:pyruvate/2-oxoglutarate/acetoin dehydrogenase E1 component